MRPIEWNISDGLTGYPQAVQVMEARADAIAKGNASEAIWLVEHPALYTAGTSANREDLIDANRFPVFGSQRGVQYT